MRAASDTDNAEESSEAAAKKTAPVKGANSAEQGEGYPLPARYNGGPERRPYGASKGAAAQPQRAETLRGVGRSHPPD